MRLRRFLVAGLAAALLAPLPAGAGSKKKPELRLRALPRTAVPPATILFIAEIVGGDDHDASLHCPRLEWEWGDEGRSVVEPQCSEFVAGETKIERRFTAEHEYRDRLNATVEVRVLIDDKVRFKARTQVIIGPRPQRKGEIKVQ
jgi:hypothetical protein